MIKLEPLVPFPYQEMDVSKLIENNGTGIVATQVGGGKTLIAIEVAKRMKTTTNLVIAPKGTHKRAWQQTIQRQIPETTVSYINSSKDGKRAFVNLEKVWRVGILSAQSFLEKYIGLELHQNLLSLTKFTELLTARATQLKCFTP